MNSPSLIYKETDLTTSATLPVGGISGVILTTKRGPVKDPNIYTSWESFRKVYGGFINNNVDPGILQVKRALDGGAALRISRLLHYTDVSDNESYDADFSAAVSTNTFTLTGAAAVGHTLIYTSGTAISQAFTTDGLTTMKLLAAKIKASLGTVNDAIAISATKLLIVPSGAAIVGDTLTATGAGAPTSTRVASSNIMNSAGNELFSLTPKYPGKDYDNIKVTVSDPSNGQAGYWDLRIDFISDTDLSEVYRNIFIPGSPTANNSKYLDEVVRKSKIVDVVYADLSAIAVNPIVPVNYTVKFYGGSDGGAIVAADMIGDSAGKTGLYAFDGADDITQVAILEKVIPTGVHAAGFAYATNRKDLQYFAWVGDENDNEAEVISEKDGLNVDSSYGMLFAGFTNVVDPSDSNSKAIPSLGDILGLASYSEKNFGLWFSFSGYNRGLIQNSLGAANSWGASGNKANLDALANRQINVVINRNKRTVLWGSFTGQLATSQLSLANVRRFHIYLKKVLGPVLESFIEEPCDIPTFKQIWLAGKRIMDPLIPKRAIFDYRWEGDQFANTPADFVINDPNEVTLGRYKVRLFVKDISSLQEFTIDIAITPTGISFDDALTLVTPGI